MYHVSGCQAVASLELAGRPCSTLRRSVAHHLKSLVLGASVALDVLAPGLAGGGAGPGPSGAGLRGDPEDGDYRRPTGRLELICACRGLLLQCLNIALVHCVRLSAP